MRLSDIWQQRYLTKTISGSESGHIIDFAPHAGVFIEDRADGGTKVPRNSTSLPSAAVIGTR